MNIKQEITGNKKNIYCTGNKQINNEKINISIEDIEKTIREKYDLVKNKYNFLENKSSGALTNSKPNGKYIFEKVFVDFSSDNDIIDLPIVTIEPPPVTLDEDKQDKTSLPYGLKKTTKTKRKRATTRKKKTEE